MGRIESGEVKVGDEVTVLPSGLSSRVTKIHTFDGELERVIAHQSVTLLLEDAIDCSRGDAIVARHNAPTVAKKFDASLCWLSPEPLEIGRKYIIKHTTKVVKAIVNTVHYMLDITTLGNNDGVPTLNLNAIGRVAIKTQLPLAFNPYEKNRATAHSSSSTKRATTPSPRE